MQVTLDVFPQGSHPLSSIGAHLEQKLATLTAYCNGLLRFNQVGAHVNSRIVSQLNAL